MSKKPRLVPNKAARMVVIPEQEDILNSKSYEFLQQGMGDKAAYWIVFLLKVSQQKSLPSCVQVFDEFEQFASDQLKR